MAGPLDVALDELIQPSGGWEERGRAKGGRKGARAPSGGTKLDMSLDDVIWEQEEPQGPKGKGKGKSKGRGQRPDWDEPAWRPSPGKGAWWGGRGNLGSKGGTPPWVEHDDWRSSEGDGEWEDWGGRGWRDGRGAWQARGGKGDGWAQARPRQGEEVAQGRPRAEAREEPRRPATWLPEKRRRDEEPFGLRSKRVKVTNIPRDLDARDIKDAFEAEAGKTARCEVERGAAWLTFIRVEDARKAVETFDRGELNGKTISVTLEP